MSLSQAFTFAQLLGYLAFAVSFLSYQTRSQRRLFGINMTTDVAWAIHYIALGGVMPAIAVLVSAMRTALAVFLFPAHKIAVALVAFSILVGLCLTFNVDGPKGLLLIATAAVYSLCVVFHDSYAISRSLMALGLVLWIGIGFLYGSIAEVASSGLSLFSLAVAAIRHHFLPTTLPQNTQS